MSNSTPPPNAGSQPAPKKSSERKIEANRKNGLRSTGPKDTTSTRFNAAKHGLLRVGVRELDDAEGYRAMLRDLKQEKNPVGPIEVFLVESAALDMTRLQRARRLEAEYITSVLNPPTRDAPFPDFDEVHQGRIVDPGLPAQMACENVQPLVGVFQRYESMIALKLYRTLHELERLQRLRQGERLPAPVAVDVSVHTDSRELDSFAECEDKALEGSLSEPPDKRESINSRTAPAESEAATSLDLNVEADALGLPSFLQPSEKEPLAGSESKPPDREEDLNSQVVPENGEATETATEDISRPISLLRALTSTPRQCRILKG